MATLRLKPARTGLPSSKSSVRAAPRLVHYASTKPEPAREEQLERLRKTGWEVIDQRLSKGVKFEGKGAFRRTWAFMTDVARKADELKHHPDWTNSFNQIVIELQRHSEKSLTALDVELATAIDEAAERWAVATELPEIGKSVL